MNNDIDLDNSWQKHETLISLFYLHTQIHVFNIFYL